MLLMLFHHSTVEDTFEYLLLRLRKENYMITEHGAENLGAQGGDPQGSHDSYGQGVSLGTMILVVEHHHAYCGSM